MARPQRPLDVTKPLHAFADELRKLRVAAGEPKYLTMARKVGDVSRTALAEAAGGDHLPTWHTVEKYVLACGGDPNDWRQRWEEVRDQAAERTASATGPTDDEGFPVVTGPTPARRSRKPAIFVTAAALVVAALGTATPLLLQAPAPGESPTPRAVQPIPTGPAVVIQNMIAIGAADLIEDPTPAYLSARTVPRCRLNGCMIPNTILITGTTAVATCHAQGTMVANYNLDSSEVQRNPHRARSALWYRLVLPDGSSGFLSEVYLAPVSRGGIGLPGCPADVPVSSP